MEHRCSSLSLKQRKRFSNLQLFSSWWFPTSIVSDDRLLFFLPIFVKNNESPLKLNVVPVSKTGKEKKTKQIKPTLNPIYWFECMKKQVGDQQLQEVEKDWLNEKKLLLFSGLWNSLKKKTLFTLLFSKKPHVRACEKGKRRPERSSVKFFFCLEKILRCQLNFFSSMTEVAIFETVSKVSSESPSYSESQWHRKPKKKVRCWKLEHLAFYTTSTRFLFSTG